MQPIDTQDGNDWYFRQACCSYDIDGHNSIQIPHYMILDDTDFGSNGFAMDHNDVVDYIKEYKQFPGVGVMWANNRKDRVKITTFDATEAYDVSGIYYKTV